MTDLSNPGEINAEADNLAAAHSWEKAGTGAWIVDGVDIAHLFTSIDPADVNAFEIGSTSALDVTFYGGEAWGIGGWLVRDSLTSVTVPDDAMTTIYVGLDLDVVVDIEGGESPADVDHIIIGPDSHFDEGDPRAPIWDVEASGGSVVDTTDRRVLDKPIKTNIETNTLEVTRSVDFQERVKFEAKDGEGNVFFEMNDPDGGSVFVRGLVDSPSIGADRAVAFSNGSSSQVPVWFDVQSGAGYIEGGQRIGTRLWVGQNFNYFNDVMAQEALSGTTPTFDGLAISGSKGNIRFGDGVSGGTILAGLTGYEHAHFNRSVGGFGGTNDEEPNWEISEGGSARFGSSVTFGGDATLRKTEAWDEGDSDRVVYTDTDGGTLELVRE